MRDKLGNINSPRNLIQKSTKRFLHVNSLDIFLDGGLSSARSFPKITPVLNDIFFHFIITFSTLVKTSVSLFLSAN